MDMTNKQTETSRFHPDVPKAVRSHLLGKNHSPRHKFTFGALIMLFGVGLVKLATGIDSLILHVIADVIGYGLHGIGLIPIAKAVEEGGTL